MGSKTFESLLQYSLSLWKFQCSLLQGRSQDKTNRKLTQQLQNRITEAYRAFSANPHIFYHSSRHIFLVPLEDRLKQDFDSLQCFLHSYNLARQQQELLNVQHAKAAAQFFFPRSLPTTIVTERDCNLSSCSSCTYVSRPISPSSDLTLGELPQLDLADSSASTPSIGNSTHLYSAAPGFQPERTHIAPDCSTISSSTDADLDDANSDVAF
jgi:hypothetical protein